MERETRLELATLALARRCSTTELLPLTQIRVYRAAEKGSNRLIHSRNDIRQLEKRLSTMKFRRAPQQDFQFRRKTSRVSRAPLRSLTHPANSRRLKDCEGCGLSLARFAPAPHHFS